MKTSVELPDKLARAAQATATARGQTLSEFVAAAVADKVETKSGSSTEQKHAPGGVQKPWMRHYGRSAELAGELERVKQVVEEEFEQVNPDDWK